MGIGLLPAIVGLIGDLGAGAGAAAGAADLGLGAGAAAGAADVGAGLGAADLGAAGLGAADLGAAAGPSVLGTADAFLDPAAAAAGAAAGPSVLGTIADTAALPSAIGAGGLGDAGTAALGAIGAAGGAPAGLTGLSTLAGAAGPSAAGFAAPFSANDLIASDFGALNPAADAGALTPTPVSTINYGSVADAFPTSPNSIVANDFDALNGSIGGATAPDANSVVASDFGALGQAGAATPGQGVLDTANAFLNPTYGGGAGTIPTVNSYLDFPPSLTPNDIVGNAFDALGPSPPADSVLNTANAYLNPDLTGGNPSALATVNSVLQNPAGLGAGGLPSEGMLAGPGASELINSDLSSLASLSAPTPTSEAGIPIAEAATDPTEFTTLPAGSFDAAGAAASPLATAASGTLAPLGDTSAITLGTTATAAPTSTAAGFLSNPLGTAGSWIAQNPLMAASLGLGGGFLLKNLLFPSQLPYQGNLEAIANQAAGQEASLNKEGQEFLQPSLTGQLPPQLEQQVQNALNDAINTTQARYASLGLGNSTMVSDQISYLQNQAEAMRGTLAQQLAQTGTQLISNATSDLNIESNIYSSLMQTQIAQDNALEQSVAQFAGSLALASAIGTKTGAANSGGIINLSVTG